MFSRQDYDRYLQFFNAKNYDAVLDYYVAEPSISFAGIVLGSRASINRFYNYFHSYVDEQITVDAFVASDEILVLEARVRLTGLREMPTAALALEYPGLAAPPIGRTLVLPQYIHYRMSGDRFKSVHCVLSGEPELLPQSA